MVDKKEDYSYPVFIVGLMSIVLAFLQPLPGLVLGIVGVVWSKKANNNLVKKARILSILGIIISIVFIAAIVIGVVMNINTGLNQFPTA